MLLEIISEAVVGRGEVTVNWSHQVTAQGVSQVLGVRVGQATCALKHEGNGPQADITLEADLWCLGSGGTEVLHTSSHTVQEVSVSLRGTLVSDPSYHLRLVGTPRATGVHVEGETIHVDFSATVEVEARALTRYWVRAEDHVPEV
ncbi:hypothetical protein J2Z79_001220 [Symbiobacterium terraclitae]|uniref:Uncharacterized protein n=1 Tax=Symbiobacterium terraclitae TaxID=557451 RepID=A0ABS4JS84_9FIRM|nr:hypothetical protein [Symbiobacterium terraclitae]MBP2017835.1 hypothetical protein [Symbiobacterium terraclitae]